MLQFRDIKSLCFCQLKILFTEQKASSKYTSYVSLAEYTKESKIIAEQ